MKEVLLTVSGRIDPEIQSKIDRGERPEADYLAMAHAFDADLLDYPEAQKICGWVAPILARIGGLNLVLAWACYLLRRQYRVIFTDGEQVGIPLALLLKFMHRGPRPRHLMIAHILSVTKKMQFFDALGIQAFIDLFFVYSSWQKRFIEQRWKVPADRVQFTPFMVDANFFSPQHASFALDLELPLPGRPLISTAGLEYRDYPTLLEAVRGLDVQVVIAAASPWSKRPDTTEGREIPENVLVRRFSQFELRQIYAQSRFIVMPLYPVNFQAGVTAILEAMAMGKAVICSQTPGQDDIVVEGETGLYVPPQDPAALRAAILDLLSNPEKAEAFGCNGRLRILQWASLEKYVQRLNKFVDWARR